MAEPTHKRSPLAVQLLVLLAEEPMHAYRMQKLIKERRKDDIVNIAQRNSIYQTLDRLVRTGLVQVQGTAREDNRPERTVYRITEEGRRVLDGWLRAMLATPAREFPEFPVALAALPLFSPEEAAELLAARAAALEGLLAEHDEAAGTAERLGLPRLFMIDDEYRRATVQAELHWVRSLAADLREGRLAWDMEWLRAVAERMEER